MNIGNIVLPKTACLAPMAGVTDRAFREICKEMGSCYLVGELASSKGLTYGQGKTKELLGVTDMERPIAVQIFGDDPLIMAKAAELAMTFSPDIIDINMGCPAPKVNKSGGGSALMKNPPLAGEITREVVRAVPVPVTVKFRKGWDENSVNAVEFAKIMEANGAAAVTIHGRTRQQFYAPSADWSIIKAVKESVSIPVIGNGDVNSVESCIAMYEQTGCDLVMIGRAAQGNPWIFKRIDHYMKTGEILPAPTVEERVAVLREHVRRICEYKGEHTGMREARKHAAWYLKGFNGAASLRRRSGELMVYDDLIRLTDEILELQ
ncbi:MAG: tRNA dihydrouridine synthase DusB [Oscillospiraceae bacterium]|nr:tRNA dihydrouridine synthase DusB [Oscillospiraceae bacterium]